MNTRKKKYPWCLKLKNWWTLASSEVDICSEEYAESLEFNKFKLRYRCIDNNLEKNTRANIFKSNTAQILDIVLLMIGLCLDN